MRRNRSVLIDNTIGRIFRNVSDVSDATAANIIAGSKIETTIIASPKTATTRPLTNLGNKGVFFPSGCLITSVQLSLNLLPPIGQSLLVNLKTGTTYQSSNIIQTCELPEFIVSRIINTSINILPNNYIFVDIIQVGSRRAGTGFSIRFNYYRG